MVKGIFFPVRRNSPKRARAASFVSFLDHNTGVMIPLDKGSARHTDLYLNTQHSIERYCCPRQDSFCSLSLSLYFYPYFCVLILVAFAFCFYSYCVTHTTQTPMRIRTRNPSKPEAADHRFRQLGHWDRRLRALEWIKPVVLYRCP